MQDDLSNGNLRIKAHADEILYQKGLLDLLKNYGTPHITGSYELDLMTWRDLDIYIESNQITEENFFELGKELMQLLQPVKMNFRNERITKTKGLPNGLYWGIYLGNERAGDWKIDIWAVDSKELELLKDYCSNIKARLNKANSKTILEIKSLCWKNPLYRKSFTSSDIYSAVLDHGISNFEEFQQYLNSRVSF
jgi:hypothetical protein